ncbi:proton-coupled folate transporter [Toxorhynchites rutilus septentrionalis]|uniref:proton-coupled folate transporter n=1 Tax=Toxorhynchites rutilus septentrionalis TaxID=329112 RepID=UPI00247AE46C|nr:proton-coupled folate transporter [Toxorhynchites rutilus septentrionalis]XP_055642315.1 proton-coupled folate transporter [Toxorhynchites rutilus septentrionalis]XP_055642317.1 proton-coupled folate transporter [Toxorhynchites rutilus septentrionalis]XP_055642318.1 proton-coupled folate transporter [Toxorhynchites rutilus septentrionalis]XP_055642319.1 proton-coupled folate transporter [Toxorhynchites rutilus septentrionalis]
MGDEIAEASTRTERRWFQKITVEPSMFLYMMAFMLTSVVEQGFFLYKACTVNHGYSHDVCINIENHSNIKKEVQVTTSTFHMWNSIAMYAVPTVLALFLGAWSDRRGRKLPLILGLIGKLIYSVMIVVNTRMENWPVEYIIYTATIPSVLTGADIAIFASCFAYISDITTVTDRTLRITILDATYLSTMPIGVALGNLIYNRTAKSFTVMFTINASLLFASILYSALRLKSRITDQQVSILELRWYRIPGDFFDRNHVVHSVKTFFKKRTLHRRIYLHTLMVAMSFYTFQRDEKPKMYLYTQLKFNWDLSQYSYFKTYQSAAYVVMMFIGVPFFTKVLGMRDTFIIMIGATAHAAARFVYIFAEVDWLLYVGASVSSLGPVVAPVLRSMISKMVPITERGIIFSFLSVFDNAVPLFSGILYTQVYNASVNSFPQAFFLLTMGTQAMVFVLTLGVHISLRGKTFEESTTETVNGLIEGEKLPASNGSVNVEEDR